jgi:hypothetical protein
MCNERLLFVLFQEITLLSTQEIATYESKICYTLVDHIVISIFPFDFV